MVTKAGVLASLLLALVSIQGCRSAAVDRDVAAACPKTFDIGALQHSVFMVSEPARAENAFGMTVDGGDNYHGSCFYTMWNGRPALITAWHVVEERDGGPYPILDHWESGTIAKFTRYKMSDMGIAYLSAIPSSWVPLRLAMVPYGGYCASVGYPAFNALTCAGGRVVSFYTAKSENMGDGTYLKVHGIAIPGMSGGPVIDCEGRVFALVALGRGDIIWHAPLSQPLALPIGE